MANLVFNSPADFNANPVTVAAGQIFVVNDVNNFEVAHWLSSRPNDFTDNNGYFASKFADTTVYAYPLTIVFSADPNYQPPSSVDFSF